MIEDKLHMDRLKFFKESIMNLSTVGTVTRSSRYLCASVVKLAELDTAEVVIELGAGDGVMTRHILRAMKPGAVLFAFEINPKFSKQLNTIKDSRLKVVTESAENLPAIIETHGYSQVDTVISALPFSVFPYELAADIVQKSADILRPHGPFVQIHYSLKMRKLYEKVFGNVLTNFEVRNVPPAFVLLSKKTDNT